MSAQVPQNLKNHARLLPLFHGVLALLVLANVVYALTALVRQRSMAALFGLVVATSLVLMFYYLRAFPLAAQNRVIRLEMRLRLQALLPPELMARFGEIEPSQLTALRFAGDAEMPDLVRQVLEGKLEAGAEIKRQIKSWQADYLRV